VGLIQHGAFVFRSGLFTVYVDSGTDLTVLFGPIMKITRYTFCASRGVTGSFLNL
jgi:hypothetical protein